MRAFRVILKPNVLCLMIAVFLVNTSLVILDV